MGDSRLRFNESVIWSIWIETVPSVRLKVAGEGKEFHLTSEKGVDETQPSVRQDVLVY